MKSFKLWLESNTEIKYHVTKTSSVKKIKKQGIKPFQTTNWVTGDGDRYGSGEIYVFDSFKDAVKWALKMEWDVYGKFGSGKISVLEIKDSDEWEIDNNDPLTQHGRDGNWLKSMKTIPPDNILNDIPITKFYIDYLRS